MAVLTGSILGILYLLMCIAHLICFVVVVIKQFKDAGPVHGIIGIVTCSLWTLIWGWMNAKRLDISKIMLAWSVILVALVILYVVVIAGAVAAGSMAH